MSWTILADGVLLLHAAFVAFAALGGLLALRCRWMPWLHLPAAAWGAFIELTGRICPLTPIENQLRIAGGSAGYEGDFLERYLVRVLYPEALTRDTQLALAGLLVLSNVVIYVVVWRRRHGESRLRRTAPRA